MNEQLIRNYKILEKLSEGEMITVYKADDILFAREVIIKVLRQEPSIKIDIVEAFHSEAATLAKLTHSNIPKLHSFFAKESELFMVLEFLDGKTLDKVLKRRGTLSCKEAIPIFIQVLNCIEYAHSTGTIHGNINPSNIMLTNTGTLKILGFGIVNYLKVADIPRAEEFRKTQPYLSPEQIKGREADAVSDVYALGAMLYEILTGKTPFNADIPEEMDAARLYKILTGKTPFNAENKFELKEKQIGEKLQTPRTINPDIPEEIEAAIMKALDQDSGGRFQTAIEFLEALVKVGIDAYDMRTGITGLFPKKSAIQLSQPGQPPIWKEVFQGSVAESLKTPSKSISNFAIQIKDTSINRNLIQADEIDKSDIGSSFSSLLVQRHQTIAGATIFAIIIILFISQFIFFQSENHQNEIISAKIENEQSDEVKTGYEARELDIVTMPVPPVKPIVKREPRTVPVRTVIKKKELRNSKAGRLRRAERILTGV